MGRGGAVTIFFLSLFLFFFKRSSCKKKKKSLRDQITMKYKEETHKGKNNLQQFALEREKKIFIPPHLLPPPPRHPPPALFPPPLPPLSLLSPQFSLLLSPTGASSFTESSMPTVARCSGAAGCSRRALHVCESVRTRARRRDERASKRWRRPPSPPAATSSLSAPTKAAVFFFFCFGERRV